MEKSKGRVRNYVVSNKELFCDFLASSLCKMQVEYLQIDNEFHFNDSIYRFYSFDECLQLQGNVVFVGIDKDKLISLSPQDLLFNREVDSLERLLHPEDSMIMDVPEIRFDDKKKNNFHSRKSIRENNKKVNQKIKNSYRQQGFRNRRNG